MSNTWALFRLKDSQVAQRVRAQWLKEGDYNLGFFHVFD